MSFNSDKTTNDLPAWLPLSGLVGASWLCCKALSRTTAQQWRWPGGRGSCDFHKIITCTCKHIHTSMCSFTPQHKNLLPLSWLSSGRGKKKNARSSNLPAIIARTTSFSWAVCFQARGCSRLRFPHFLQTFYQSGSLAESHRIWPVSWRVTTTGRLSACERLPFLSLVPSSHLHVSAFLQLHLQPSHFFTLTRGSWHAEHVFSEAFVDHKKKPHLGSDGGLF